MKFIDVGSQKKSWTIETGSLSDSALFLSIRKQRALASRVIEIDWDDAGTGATIYAGIRPVGTLRVTGGAKLG